MARIIIKSMAVFLIMALAAGMGGCVLFGEGEETEPPEVTGNTNVGKPVVQGYVNDGVFSLNSNPDASFNPLTTDSAVNLVFLPLIYEPLFEVDETMSAVPALCESYSSEDGKGYLFYVNTEIKFHDGSNLTAYDVNYSIQRAMQSSKYRERLSIILGISAMDEKTLAVNLKKPNTQFPALLNIPVIKDGSIDQSAPPGTGPFTLDLDGMRLVSFDGHPKAGDFPLDVIHLKSFQKPDEIISAYEDAVIDLVTNDPTGISNLGYGSANEIRDFPVSSMHFLGFNMEKHNAYRMALTYAVNRGYIISDLMGGRGVAATLPVWPLSPFYNRIYAANFEFSPDKFLRALDGAGVSDFNEDGLREQMITGIPVEININFIVNNESAVKVAAARDLTERLIEAGLPVTLRELAYEDYIKALKEGEFDMYYGEVRLTADFNLTELLAPGGTLNYGKTRDTGFVKLIDEYLAAGEDERKVKCDMMCQYIMENAPIIPIVFEKQEVLTHRAVASGISPTQYNIFNRFDEWTINQD